MKKIIKKLIALTKLLISRENNSLKEANPLKEAKQKQLDLCEERINILEKEFQRLAQLRNPNLSQQDIELKQRMIEERIGAVKNYISSG
ncbi:MAG TPA: hypothetical protein VJ461_01325 [Candidatus Nanoarchaeia archaeon]|nr:hypothetical protein [Candidatus Nanoarchaeia archaeon]